jgi:N-dimethylarginine dimethylaminohydrolase
MRIHSQNEYGKLRSVVLGRPDLAVIPKGDVYFDRWVKYNPHTKRPEAGKLPDDVIKQAADDLYVVKDILEDRDIQVYRPEIQSHAVTTVTGHHVTTGFNSYLARDFLLTIGSWAIECPTPFVSKHRETMAYQTIKQEAIQSGARWIAAPTPPMGLAECVPVVDGIRLTERYPTFKGSDILKFDDKILYALSATSNRTGATWLQYILGTEYEVIVYDRLNPIHNLDYSIVPIGKDILLLNVDRLSGDNLPSFLKSYRKIWCHECVDTKYYRFPMASRWTGMNVLCIDHETVLVDDTQKKLIDQLRNERIAVIEIPLAHSQTFGGGLHRIVSDLERE